MIRLAFFEMHKPDLSKLLVLLEMNENCLHVLNVVIMATCPKPLFCLQTCCLYSEKPQKSDRQTDRFPPLLKETHNVGSCCPKLLRKPWDHGT